MGLFSGAKGSAGALGTLAGSASFGSIGGFFGGALGSSIEEKYRRDQALDDWNRNADLQREFAQHGIRWKIEDAKKAGIHPLAALGAPTASASPSFIGDGGGANTMAMGQDLTRAIQATRTAEEREMTKLNLASAKLDVEGKAIDNQIRGAQLKKLESVGPAFPGSANFMPGQGNSNLVQDNPKMRTHSQPGRPAQEAGWVPDVGFSRTDTGLTPVVPNSLSESLEDDLIGKALWRVRNQLMPNFTGEGKPPSNMLPRGAKDWEWSYTKQEWQPVWRKSMGFWERNSAYWAKSRQRGW